VGTLMALLSIPYGGWLVAAGGLSVALLLGVANLMRRQDEENHRGLTTEIAALVMYAVGAYLVLGHISVAVLVGGIVAVLLQLKEPMHDFVGRMSSDDIRVIMQFVLLALVILPVLPNQNYGPFDAFNPHEIWRMVVLIVGLSVAGYIIYKFLGAHAGTLLGGILGGLVSSTATTVSYARRTRDQPQAVHSAAAVIAIASAVAMARVIVEVGVVAAPAMRYVAPPLVALLLWMSVLALLLFRSSESSPNELPPPKNPAELKTALVFGGLYAAIKLAVAATQHYFGDSALYFVAAVSGLTDLDAITLSTASLVNQDRLPGQLGWQVILIAALSNLVFKGGIVVLLGRRQLTLRVGLLFVAAILGGIAILWLWPTELVDGWFDTVFAL
jgi:uncharacterized membrane protein (DUF4010 family)